MDSKIFQGRKCLLSPLTLHVPAGKSMAWLLLEKQKAQKLMERKTNEVNTPFSTEK